MCLEKISVLPKATKSAQTVENSHSFFNISYTCYKSLLGNELFSFCLVAPSIQNNYNTVNLLKFSYSEKVTKFSKNHPLVIWQTDYICNNWHIDLFKALTKQEGPKRLLGCSKNICDSWFWFKKDINFLSIPPKN